MSNIFIPLYNGDYQQSGKTKLPLPQPYFQGVDQQLVASFFKEEKCNNIFNNDPKNPKSPGALLA